MIGAAIGAGMNLISGIVSGIGKKVAAKKQKKVIDEQKARAEDVFNDQYYTDYNDTAEARSAMRNIKTMYADANKTTTMLGGNVSEEAMLARQAGQDKSIAETANNMAATGTQRKDNIFNQYQAKLDSFDTMDLNRIAESGKAFDGLAGGAQQTGNAFIQSSSFEKGKW